MEIEGTVYRILPAVKGTSARGEWSKQEIVVEMPGEYNRKVCVSFWGDKVSDIAKIKEGDPVNISVNIESREYNGRWFTEVRAWRVNSASAPQPARDAAPPVTINDFEGGADEADDLPF